MIASFADQTTADIYDGLDTKAPRRKPGSVWNVAQRKLDMVEAAHEIADLRVPPGNRLEALKGYHSVRIDHQFCIMFKWADGAAKEVLITDYH